MVAKKTADYILREMTDTEGGFYSAQDADSEGVEGKYYLLEPREIKNILGEQEGDKFNNYFHITEEGNFEGKNIPNLLGQKGVDEEAEKPTHPQLREVYEYRKKRYALHLDDKILTSWNGLMIGAMCQLYRVTGEAVYLNAAIGAQDFIWEKLCQEGTLYISYRKGRRSKKAFLDDYANEILALLGLYQATLDKKYLEKARGFCEKAISEFYDETHGGFFLYGKSNEQLVLRPKETYDGAIFSGNSAMAYNLVQLYYLTGEQYFYKLAKKQLGFISQEAKTYPAGYAMFLIALSDFVEMPDKVTVVTKKEPLPEALSCSIPLDTIICVLDHPTKEYPLKNDRLTFYQCQGHSCLPPTNELGEVSL